MLVHDSGIRIFDNIHYLGPRLVIFPMLTRHSEQDFPLNATPSFQYRTIPLPGREPAVLMNLTMPKPSPVPIAIVLDFSDSCSDVTRQLSFLQRLLAALPVDWPLSIFRLSSPDPIGRNELRLLDFIECSDLLGELCFDSSVLVKARYQGSFLRPVIEALGAKLSEQSSDPKLLAFVLSDGEFTDFGELVFPDGLVIAAILNSTEASSGLAPHIPCFTMQDAALDSLIGHHRSPFYGAVTLEQVTHATDEHSVPPSDIYRVDESGRLTAWDTLETHTFNLTKSSNYILLDTDAEIAKGLRWKVRSASSSALTIIDGAIESSQGNRRLERKIADSFQVESDDAASEVLFQFNPSSPKFKTAVQAASQAMRLAESSQAWVDDEGVATVFRDPAFDPFCDDVGKPNCDAMLLIHVSDSSDAKDGQVAAYALSSQRTPAMELDSGERFAGASLSSSLNIHFDPKQYRWYLQFGDANAIELEFYNAEMLDLSQHLGTTGVKIAFSGNLR